MTAPSFAGGRARASPRRRPRLAALLSLLLLPLGLARARAAAGLEGEAARGGGAGFDDSDVRLYYSPRNLWRDPSGGFVGRVDAGGRGLVLTYDFFGDPPSAGRRRTFPCPLPPPRDRTSADYPDCESMQEAVAAALSVWAEASGRVTLRRGAAGGGRADILIAWTKAFAGSREDLDRPWACDPPRDGQGGSSEPPPIARVIDNSLDARHEGPVATGRFGGFAAVAYPDSRKEFSALLFNADYCWHLKDPDACCPPQVMPSGKTFSMNMPLPLVALHESGHVFGFAHFTRPSIMGLSGGTEQYVLTDYDRAAARLLYERVLKSLLPDPSPPLKDRR